MSFCQFFGLGEMVHHSTLAEIPEDAYRVKTSTGDPSRQGQVSPSSGVAA
jgi:hypothetical protein